MDWEAELIFIVCGQFLTEYGAKIQSGLNAQGKTEYVR